MDFLINANNEWWDKQLQVAAWLIPAFLAFYCGVVLPNM